jgi:hypothetical protein
LNAQPTAPRPARIPLVCNPEARVYDIARSAQASGQRLVFDGSRWFLTPWTRPEWREAVNA